MIVVDASAIAHALVDADVNPELLVVLGEQELAAPHLIDFEVASAIRGHVIAGKLTPERGADAITDFSDLHIHRYAGLALLGEMWRIRENFTCYDAAYVALAGALDKPLVTLDAKLADASRLGVDVQVFQAA